ncbi:hypothetical protein [Sphingomonas lacunae]|nr:hypothetical protein [Sphingomonas lacunae]
MTAALPWISAALWAVLLVLCGRSIWRDLTRPRRTFSRDWRIIP